MQDSDAISRYVDAATALQKLPLGVEQRLRVINTFAITAAIAQPLLDFALPVDIETAPVFKAGN